MPRLANARSSRCRACGSAPTMAASSSTGRGPAARQSARPSLAATWIICVVRKPMIRSRSMSRRWLGCLAGRTWFMASPFEVEAEGVDGEPLALEVERGQVADIEVVLRAALEPHRQSELARHLLEFGAVQGDELPPQAPGAQHAGFRQLPPNAAAARLRIDGQRTQRGP